MCIKVHLWKQSLCQFPTQLHQVKIQERRKRYFNIFPGFLISLPYKRTRKKHNLVIVVDHILPLTDVMLWEPSHSITPKSIPIQTQSSVYKEAQIMLHNLRFKAA